MRLDDVFNPLELIGRVWPGAGLYDKQQEIVAALRRYSEVHVPAGNMLGKDYVAGVLAPAFFIRPQAFFPVAYAKQVDSLASEHDPDPHTVRVITTSVKDDHLRVLWGEIGRFLQTCAVPLRKEDGGFLTVNHRDIRRLRRDGTPDKVSYLRGMVSEKGEGMAGHHAAYTLLIIDEASGVDDMVYEQGTTWAKKVLVIGNCNDCAKTAFFRKAIEEGDVVLHG
jgi:hypothetical protein